MEKDYEVFSKSICVRKLSKEELKDILERFYGIDRFKSLERNRRNEGKKREIEMIYDIALSTLLDNGYVLPSRKLRVKDIEPSQIDKAYMQDMFVLAYMYEKVRHSRVNAEDMPISNSTRAQMIQRMEETAISQILGIKRTPSNHKIWNTKKRGDKFFIYAEPGFKKVPINIVQYQFYAALLAKTKFNPFIDIENPQMPINIEEVNEQTIKDNLGKTDAERSELLGIAHYIKPEYRDSLLYLINETPGSLELHEKKRRFEESPITIDDAEKFYKLFWKKMNDIYKKDERQIGCTEEDEEILKLCHQYLFEGLFSFKYYDMISESDIQFIYGLYPISECICCNARLAHGKLYTGTIGKDYFYKHHLRQDQSVDKWEKRIYNHTKYTMERFLPALYYLFIYYLETERLFDKNSDGNGIHDYLIENKKEIQCSFFDHNSKFKKKNANNVEVYFKIRRMEFLGYARDYRYPWF